MSHTEEIDALKKLLITHRRTLLVLLQQQALFSIAYCPPQVINSIADTRTEVRRYKEILRSLGEEINNFPGDEEDSELSKNSKSQNHLNLYQLRAPTNDFVGRKNIINYLVNHLRSLTDDSSSTIIVSIHGMGGIGKTELIYKIAQKYTASFYDAQIFVDLCGNKANPLSSEQVLQSIIQAFLPQSKLPNSLHELEKLYRSTLQGKHVLIVADDAKDTTQLMPLLPPAGCALLVTSRNRFKLPGVNMIELEVLSQSDAEALLLTIAPQIGRHASKLALLCGYLPLALRVSAGLLANDPATDIEQYLEQLISHRARLTQLQDPDEPHFDIRASIDLSYQTLSKSVQTVLCQMAVFSESFTLEAVEKIISIPSFENQTDIRRALATLYKCSLIEWDIETQRYNLHDLVRAFVTELLSDSEAIMMRFTSYYVGIAADAQTIYLRGGDDALRGLEAFDIERKHIDSGWEWLQRQESSLVIDELILAYANATIYVGHMRYDKRTERIPRLERALASSQHLALRTAECRMLNYIGLALSDIAELKQASLYYYRALTIAQEIGNRSIEGSVLGNLGLVKFALGEIDSAKSYFEQQLIIMREIGHRPNEGYALGGLAQIYVKLGEIEQAISLYEKQLAIAIETGHRRSEGYALGGLGLTSYITGYVEKAIQYHKKQIIIMREIGDQRGLSIAHWNLGCIAYMQDDNKQAILLLQVCIDIEQESGHPDVVADSMILDQIRQSLGDSYSNVFTKTSTQQWWKWPSRA